MEIKYAFDENGEFQKRLDQAYESCVDLTIPLTLINREWRQSNKSIFALKGPGQHYKDLSPLYKKWKQKHFGFVYPILLASGRLMASITGAPSADSIGEIQNKNTLIMGTKVEYGVHLQYGTTKMPARPFLFVGVEQIAPNDIKQNRLKNWLTILDNHIARSLRKSNGQV